MRKILNLGSGGIISPTPIDIHIQYSEVTGAVKFTPSKDIPYPVIVGIFSQLMIQFSNEHIAQLTDMVRQLEAKKAEGN